MKNILPNHRNKLYGGAWPVEDHEILKFCKKFFYQKPNTKKFLNDYKSWIKSTHNLQGFDNFNNLSFSNGTTESFDKFYHRHLDKRLRLFKGEYFYHQIMAMKFFKNYQWLDNDIIRKGDVVIISIPFADTGEIPKDFYKILDQCEEKNIPVLLDMAYINLTINKIINLNYRCIETITSSLSKVFPVAHYRIGIRLQQNFIDDTMLAYNQNEYINLHSVNIGHHLIKNFNADYSYQKYKKVQKKWCDKLGITKSSCYIFGIDYKKKYNEYNRGSHTNRLCFSKFF